MRQFRHMSGTTQSVKSNVPLQFALRNALRIYPSNALYTMIPKNGCSSLRYAIARANGCLSADDDPNWIHNNNTAFSADLERAFTSAYSFVVLRCPYRRLLSAFYDKIANIDAESWELYSLTDRRIHPHDLSFARFVDLIASLPRTKLNMHWRPQIDFLLFETYDDVFAIENYAEMEKTLQERIGLEIIDTRPFLRHEREAGDEIAYQDDDKAAQYPALKILNMKRQGALLSDHSFFTPPIVEKLARLYEEDFALYRASGFGHLCLDPR